ncbi:MAG: response regulator, partial [Myxococcales bacterium]|nr:response regulator [Myxococcales bacterium]
ASAAKSDFLSSMSHELRTPLNAVLGFAQLLQRDRRTPLSPRQLHMVEHILTGGEHLLHLIDEVLDLSRIEAGRLALSIEPIAVARVLETALANLSDMAGRANVEVVVAPEIAAVPPVLADRTRFAQILMNFGSNAIKYSPPGASVRITASTPTPGQVRVTVIDRGVGIPSSEQSKLFQPFYRGTQAGGAIEGTGIGLAISKRLAELMSGEVGFRSTAGAGSEFWVDLPVAREPEPTQPAHKSDAPQFTGLHRQHIIVYIEDHPANITFMRELLTDFPGLELLTAPSGELGVELVRAHQPRVVIIDINLPGMSGLEAIGLLRSWPETRSIPAIALSAAAMQHDINRARAAGFDHYLTKPVQVDELLALLEGLLAGPTTAA